MTWIRLALGTVLATAGGFFSTSVTAAAWRTITCKRNAEANL